jgi:hypothetical protein
MLRKLEPAVLIRGNLRNVYDEKVAERSQTKIQTELGGYRERNGPGVERNDVA